MSEPSIGQFDLDTAKWGLDVFWDDDCSQWVAMGKTGSRITAEGRGDTAQDAITDLEMALGA